jgi:hypothetical protein
MPSTQKKPRKRALRSSDSTRRVVKLAKEVTLAAEPKKRKKKGKSSTRS